MHPGQTSHHHTVRPTAVRPRTRATLPPRFSPDASPVDSHYTHSPQRALEMSPNHSSLDLPFCFLLPSCLLYSLYCYGDSGADKQAKKISAGVPQDWRERMAERQRRGGRYIDWYEAEVNYRDEPIRGHSDGSVCLAAASQKHHQLPPCLSSAAARPQLPQPSLETVQTLRGLQLGNIHTPQGFQQFLCHLYW